MTLLEQLNLHSITLPEPSTPGGSYTSVNIRKDIAYIAIQFPIFNGEYRYQGILGKDINTSEGYAAMELCALNVLAQLHHKITLERVLGLNHFDAYYVSDKDWDEAPQVVNGASDLFVKVLGKQGVHSRAILGVEKLPRNFCVGLTASCTLK